MTTALANFKDAAAGRQHHSLVLPNSELFALSRPLQCKHPLSSRSFAPSPHTYCTHLSCAAVCLVEITSAAAAAVLVLLCPLLCLLLLVVAATQLDPDPVKL
jgi:hypothetical protein